MVVFISKFSIFAGRDRTVKQETRRFLLIVHHPINFMRPGDKKNRGTNPGLAAAVLNQLNPDHPWPCCIQMSYKLGDGTLADSGCKRPQIP